MTLTECTKSFRVANKYGINIGINHINNDCDHGFEMDIGSSSEFIEKMTHYSDTGFFVYFPVKLREKHTEASLASSIEYMIKRASKYV